MTPLDNPEISACQLLPWDSEYFGFPIARIVTSALTQEELARIDDWCHAHAVRCLYFLCNELDVASASVASNGGFRQVDIRVTFARSAFDSNPKYKSGASDTSLKIRPAQVSDIGPLERIARTSHHNTRFYADGNFPQPLCDGMYALWIRRSVEGSLAEIVFVAEISLEKSPVGYVSCQIERETGKGIIGLVGVAETARNLGVGRLLVDRALTWFLEQGCQSIRVVTQGTNPVSQHLYEEAGFLKQSTEFWFHKWYSGLQS